MFNFLFTKTPLLFLVQSFWRDEAFSYLLAKKNILEILIASAKDFSPPLYYLILHYWMMIFGKSEIAIRSLSVIFYWATIYVMYLFLRDIFKISFQKSIFYLSLFVVNPILLYYGFEARMYSLFAFLTALSFYSLITRKKRLYVISTILGLYTHYFMLPVVLIQYFLYREKQKSIFVAFIPWMLLTLVSKNLSHSGFWINYPNIKSLFTFVGQVFLGYEQGSIFYDKKILLFSLCLLSILIFIIFKKENKDKKLLNTLFYWSLGIPFFTLLISYIKPVFLPRYLIFSSVGLSLLLVYALEKMPKFFQIFITVILICACVNFLNLETKYHTKTNLRQSITEIKSLMTSNDRLYVSSELDYFIAQYYLDESRVYVYGKSYQEIPDYIGKVLLPKEKVTSILPIYPNKAFIMDSWGNYDIRSML